MAALVDCIDHALIKGYGHAVGARDTSRAVAEQTLSAMDCGEGYSVGTPVPLCVLNAVGSACSRVNVTTVDHLLTKHEVLLEARITIIFSHN